MVGGKNIDRPGLRAESILQALLGILVVVDTPREKAAFPYKVRADLPDLQIRLCLALKSPGNLDQARDFANIVQLDDYLDGNRAHAQFRRTSDVQCSQWRPLRGPLV